MPQILYTKNMLQSSTVENGHTIQNAGKKYLLVHSLTTRLIINGISYSFSTFSPEILSLQSQKELDQKKSLAVQFEAKKNSWFSFFSSPYTISWRLSNFPLSELQAQLWKCHVEGINTFVKTLG